MADTYNALLRLNMLFQVLTMEMLGLISVRTNDVIAELTLSQGGTLLLSQGGSLLLNQEELSDAASTIRISWQSQGQPAWKITDDVSIISVTEKDSEYNKPREIVRTEKDDDNANFAMSKTRVLTVSWTFYGPNAYDNAQLISDYIFMDAHRSTLAENNIYLIPDITSPVRVPELFQTQWWERTDLKMNFNELIIRNVTVPYLKSSEITVIREVGADIVIDVTELTT